MNRCLILLAIIFLFISSDYSQEKHEFKLNNDDTFKIPEVGAYITRDKDNFRVQFVAPESVRLPAYKNVDLRKDDIIKVINGKTVKNFNDMKETYDKLKPGRDIKLDVKRSGKMISVIIKKADPKDLPQKKMVKMESKRMENKFLLAGYGILIGKINEKPMIEKLFHEDNTLVTKAGLKGGDLLTNINGQTIKTFDQFKIAYESITPGQEVRIKFGDKFISFKKK